MSRINKLTTFDKENNISDEYSYEYDRAGNKIKSEKRREDRTNVYHYSYDKLDRIIKVTDEKKLSEIYSYDRAGNRISKEKRDETGNILSQEKYIYDRQNKLISADGLKELLGDKVYGTVRFEYDKRGNTTRIKDSSKIIGEYEFSKENLLAKATNRNGEVTTFSYDGAGRRVRVKVENPNEKLTKEYKYINDPTTPYSTILMRYGKDKQTEKYIHGIGHESTEKLNQWKETERTFYTHNELGSQIREYDNKGNTTNSYEYDIFGVPSFREDGYNYTGYTNDSSTNLMFAQARYYLPETGRFISEDSYKGIQNDIQSQNRYIYCTNNPLKYVDPSGHTTMAGSNPWAVLAENVSNDIGKLGKATSGLKGIPIGKALGPIGFLMDSTICGEDTIEGNKKRDWVSNYILNSKNKSIGKTDAHFKTKVSEEENINKIIIYRWGSATNKNLTPREKDVTGLSFSTVPPSTGKYCMTTMDAINSTGKLVAIKDGATHVSVLPVDMTKMEGWISSRESAEVNPHELTKILKSVVK